MENERTRKVEIRTMKKFLFGNKENERTRKVESRTMKKLLFGNMENERTRKVESRTMKKFLSVGEACMTVFRPTQSLKTENVCQLRVLNRRDCNFCFHCRDNKR